MTVAYHSSYESACEGKRQYANSRDAKRVARRAQAQTGGRVLSPYRCEWCGWIHLGHVSDWGREQARLAV